MMAREVKEANLVGSAISTYPVAEGGRDGNLVTEPKFPSPPAFGFASGIFAPQPQKRGSCKGTH